MSRELYLKITNYGNSYQNTENPESAGTLATNMSGIQLAVKRMIDTRLRNCKWKPNIVRNLESITSRFTDIQRSSLKG